MGSEFRFNNSIDKIEDYIKLQQVKFPQEFYGNFYTPKPKCSTRSRGERCPGDPIIEIEEKGMVEYYCRACLDSLILQERQLVYRKRRMIW